MRKQGLQSSDNLPEAMWLAREATPAVFCQGLFPHSTVIFFTDLEPGWSVSLVMEVKLLSYSHVYHIFPENHDSQEPGTQGGGRQAPLVPRAWEGNCPFSEWGSLPCTLISLVLSSSWILGVGGPTALQVLPSRSRHFTFVPLLLTISPFQSKESLFILLDSIQFPLL